jgi:hypothetical protein
VSRQLALKTTILKGKSQCFEIATIMTMTFVLKTKSVAATNLSDVRKRRADEPARIQVVEALRSAVSVSDATSDGLGDLKLSRHFQIVKPMLLRQHRLFSCCSSGRSTLARVQFGAR